jgi:phosphopantetheine--protein transferase-like protein
VSGAALTLTARLWWLDLPTWTAAGGAAAARRALTSADLARAASIKHAPTHAMFIAARAALRLALSWHAPHVDPRDWALSLGPHGKPALPADAPADLAFNISHSADLAVIAVVQPPGRRCHVEVGVDVERPRDLDADALSRRFFTPAERAWTMAGDLSRFFTLWTLKEAALKGTGRGLSALEDVEVTPAAQGEGEATLRLGAASDTARLHWRLRYDTRRGTTDGDARAAYALAVGASTPFTLRALTHDAAADLLAAPHPLCLD